tara:strand:- start:232 stop:804 length:573 start_codon:yes stop_codon:yes gene_type:complete
MEKKTKDEKILFNGDDYLFKSYLKNCNIYFEYGVGDSTIWVLENTSSRIISVDTDKKWIKKIDISKNKKRINLNWINLGDLGNWGRPKSYKYRKYFNDYINNVWKFDLKADVILIDGRFRVACFLFSLINSKEDSIIIFDDYINRPHYHVVEEVIKMHENCGRQAIFKVPSTFNKKLAKELLNNFTYVFD